MINEMDACIEEWKNLDVPLIIYGGVVAPRVAKYLNKYKIPFEGFAVNKEFIKSDRICEYPLFCIEDYVSQNKCAIIVGFENFKVTMIDNLKKDNIKKIYTYDFPGRFIIEEDNSFPLDFITQNKDSISQLKSWLHDEKSIEALDNYINQKITCCYSKPYDATSQYFDNDIMKYTDNEVFIDCGAYHGETALEFIKSLKAQGINSYNKIIEFEPDSKNAQILRNKLNNEKNIEIIEAGVYKESTTLSFSAEGTTTSSLCETGNIKVPVKSIDDVLNGNKATFIKMDIEGSELDALHGAENTIKNYKPKLAICAYHKVEDLLTIPQYIKSLRPDYEFYFRNYRHSGYEAVLYAI